MKHKPFPAAALESHTAILGKTGSGKTSTEKLAVEQVVDEGFRVCILDAIKSDWWGLTSSADGKKPGLPFKILGGPHGHVPLHSSAGAVIGGLVGSGKLPLSIIDMADFEPGGLQRFFVDFAPALMRSMRGVLYLVIEEAHEFAPKERSGFGAENMAIHWAKKLATAGRSKGIRLIVATQRVQSLHNAVLGSCETVVAHRLGTPADQKPILDWLKANSDKVTTDKVGRSLSSLPTGTGWLCSGEARIFEQIAFPKFKTFDNAATPMRDGPELKVKTAPVDQDELRAIIGGAVEEAEQNDPKRLRARIAELEKSKGKPDAAALKEAREAGRMEGLAQGRAETDKAVREALARAGEQLRALAEDLDSGRGERARTVVGLPRAAESPKSRPEGVKLRAEGVKLQPVRSPSDGVTNPQQRILDAIATLMVLGVENITKEQAGLVAGVKPTSGSFGNNIGRLRTLGLVAPSSGDGMVALTEDGRTAANFPDKPPTTEALQATFLSLLTNPQGAILNVLISAWPKSLSKDELGQAVGVQATSGSFGNNLGRLRTLSMIDYPTRGQVRAEDILFPQS